MNKKGFTLVELLAVIVILGLLGLLAIPAIEKTLKKSRTDLYEIQITNIIDGAKNWIADHPYDIPKNNNDELTISLCELKIGSYVDAKISNPRTDKMFDCGTKIKIKNVNNTYKYDIDFTDTVEEDIPDEISYPKIKLLNDYLEYVNQYDAYFDLGIMVDGSVLSEENDTYKLNVTTNILDLNNQNKLNGYASTTGNYIVKYEIINKNTDVKTVIYRTIIVTSN